MPSGAASGRSIRNGPISGTAQNPDIYFQAAKLVTTPTPDTVAEVMRQVSESPGGGIAPDQHVPRPSAPTGF